MTLLTTKKGREITKRVTLKNVKLGFGHDLCGAYADFSLDGKKMGYFNDDGWGGETDIVYVSDKHQKEFEKFLKDNNVAQIMFDNGWDFMEEVEKINFHSQAEEVINSAINLKEEEKAEKKIMKACEKGIYYKTANGYKGVSFRLSLKEIVEKYGEQGRLHIQNSYNQIKGELKNGEHIVNKNLESLGIRI